MPERPSASSVLPETGKRRQERHQPVILYPCRPCLKPCRLFLQVTRQPSPSPWAFTPPQSCLRHLSLLSLCQSEATSGRDGATRKAFWGYGCQLKQLLMRTGSCRYSVHSEQAVGVGMDKRGGPSERGQHDSKKNPGRLQERETVSWVLQGEGRLQQAGLRGQAEVFGVSCSTQEAVGQLCGQRL